MRIDADPDPQPWNFFQLKNVIETLVQEDCFKFSSLQDCFSLINLSKKDPDPSNQNFEAVSAHSEFKVPNPYLKDLDPASCKKVYGPS